MGIWSSFMIVCVAQASKMKGHSHVYIPIILFLAIILLSVQHSSADRVQRDDVEATLSQLQNDVAELKQKMAQLEKTAAEKSRGPSKGYYSGASGPAEKSGGPSPGYYSGALGPANSED